MTWDLGGGWTAVRRGASAAAVRWEAWSRGAGAGDWIVFGLVGAAAVLLLPAVLGLLLAVAVLAVVLLWIREFVRLMSMSPAVFPGRHDRWVWIVLMLAVPPVGLVAFWMFRRGREEEGAPRVDKPAWPYADEL
jgi:hypothetical protein